MEGAEKTCLYISEEESVVAMRHDRAMCAVHLRVRPISVPRGTVVKDTTVKTRVIVKAFLRINEIGTC